MLALQLRFISPAAFQRQAYKQMSQDILHSEYSKCFCQNTQKIHTQEEEGRRSLKLFTNVPYRYKYMFILRIL